MSAKTTTSTAKSRKKEKDNMRLTSDPIPRELENRVREKLITARVSLLLKKPFFGNIATRLVLTPADEWCPTAATDGRKFYYNHAFVDSLRTKEVEFLFGHEVLHVVYEHMDRRGDRDPQLHNIACDYCVNQDLVDQKVGELITTVPALYDRKYSGWSSEQVYDDLYKNAIKIDLDDLLSRLLDDHMEDQEDGGAASDGDGNASDGDKDGNGRPQRPKLSDEEKKAIRDEIREAVLNAAKQCQAGDLPAGVARLVNKLTEPKMNWRQMLRMCLDSTVQNDYSWLVPSRRGWDMDAILPGMTPEQQIDIAVALDMSGSIGEAQARDFLSEIAGIMQQFEQYRIHVWCFDTDVYNDQVFTSDDVTDIRTYKVAGGGGTSFDVNWRFMKKRGIEPKRFIMFTDMYTGDGWGDANYCETLFISHGGSKIVAPHGLTVEYDEKA